MTSGTRGRCRPTGPVEVSGFPTAEEFMAMGAKVVGKIE
jgi:hypothetical protein